MRTTFARALCASLCGLSLGARPAPEAGASALLRALHESHVREIELGGLAWQKGTGEEVRSYGRTLVEGHEHADVELLQYATAAGIGMGQAKGQQGQPQAPSAGGVAAKLSGLRGRDFDKQFLAVMLEDHRQAIARIVEVRHALPEGDALAPLLDRALPALQQQEDGAQHALDKLAPPARRSKD